MKSRQTAPVPLPPIIPDRQPLSMTLSVDAGLSKQRDIHMFDARRIEQAHRHRLQKASKFQEYLDLEDSGNSDPLVQIEKIKNVIKKTTTTSTYEKRISSKDEQKLV